MLKTNEAEPRSIRLIPALSVCNRRTVIARQHAVLHRNALCRNGVILLCNTCCARRPKVDRSLLRELRRTKLHAELTRIRCARPLAA